MVECFQEKTVKTRKPHQCEYCGKPIPQGGYAHVESGVFEDGWFRRYSCTSCAAHISSFWEYCEGECNISVQEAFRFFLASEMSDVQYWPFEDDWEKWR